MHLRLLCQLTITMSKRSSLLQGVPAQWARFQSARPALYSAVVRNICIRSCSFTPTARALHMHTWLWLFAYVSFQRELYLMFLATTTQKIQNEEEKRTCVQSTRLSKIMGLKGTAVQEGNMRQSFICFSVVGNDPGSWCYVLKGLHQ